MRSSDAPLVRRRLGPFAASVLDFRLPTFEAWYCDDDARDARERFATLKHDTDETVDSVTAALRILGFEFESLDLDPADRESPRARRVLYADGSPVATLTIGSGETLADGLTPESHWPTPFADVGDVRWHVVTDGRRWRLSRRPTESSTPIGSRAYYTAGPSEYYEVDLECALAGSLVEFKRFYAFFRAEAFDATDGDPFLDRVAAASDAARRELAAGVRRNGRTALHTIGRELVADAVTDDSSDRTVLQRTKSRSLAALFRVLVALYADSRKPLTTESERECDDSFDLYSTLRWVDEAAQTSDGSLDHRLAKLGARVRARIETVAERFEGAITDRSDGVFARRIDNSGEVAGSSHREERDATVSTAALTDHDLGVVAFDLGTAPLDGTRIPVDFAEVPVATLGGVYESLTACEFALGDDSEGPGSPERQGCPESPERREGQDPTRLRLVDDDTDRRASGAYYTPDGVVDTIVASAVGPLVDEVETTLDGDGFERGTSASLAAFEERVLDLTALDPAMGCGRFLLATAAYLTDRVAAAARAVDDAPRFDRRAFRRRVASRCLYGVDRNAVAVELALISVWLAVEGVRPSRLARHLRVGNALVGDVRRSSVGQSPTETRTVDGDDPFDWWRAFPIRFDADPSSNASRRSSSGFDAVVGNPPYVRGRRLAADAKAYFDETYRCAHGAYDLYALFIERAAALGRRTAFLVPNKWTTTRYGRPVRDLLLDELGLEAVLDLSDADVFADVNVYPVVVTFDTARDARATGITIRHVEGKLDPTGSVAVDATRSVAVDPARSAAVDSTAAVGPAVPADSTVTLDVEFVDRLADRVLPLSLSPDFAPIATDALASRDRLGAHVTMAEGIHTGNVRDELIVDEWRDEDCRRLVDGSSVDRYVAAWDGRWIRHDPDLIDRDAGEYAELRDRRVFECDEKLLVCDIGDRPTAAYDDEGLYALNTLYAVRSRPESDLPLRYVLGVFNSAFVERYFRELYGGTHVNGGYLRFKPMFCADVPIPAPSPERNAKITEIDAVSGEIETLRERGVRIPRIDGAVDLLCVLTDRLDELHRERRSVAADPLVYLDPPTSGTRLADLDGCTVVGDAEGGPLAETCDDGEGGRPRIGRVTVERDDSNDLSVSATVRRKSGIADAATGSPDSWGYVESEPILAYRLTGLDETTASLVEAFVPAAIDRGRGFAGFRARATKTKSLLDRLGTLRIPGPTDTGTVGDLRRYQSASMRATDLDERLSLTEALVDRVVSELYGLSEEERAVVDRVDRADS